MRESGQGALTLFRLNRVPLRDTSAVNGQTMTLTGEGEPQALNTELRTEDANVVAPRPLAIGRGLEVSDYQPGSEKVVVLHHNFWTQARSADPPRFSIAS